MKENKKSKKSIIIIIVIVILLLLIGLIGDSDTANTVNTNIQTSEPTQAVDTNKLKLSYGAKEFYEIMCEVAELEKIDPQDLVDELVYESANANYNIEILSDKNDNIESIRLMAFNNDYTNFFMAINRIFETQPDEFNADTILNNLGKENKISFENVDFEFTNGTIGKPILTITIN